MARAGTWSTCFMYLSPGLGFSAARWLRHSSFNDANSFFQYSSVPLLIRVRLCNRMVCSTSGFPVHHQLLELTKTHVHRVSDAIQPSHLLSSPSPAVNLSQHQGLFQFFTDSDSHSTGVSASASILLMNIQSWFPLGWTCWISLQSQGLSRVFSNTTV